MAEPAAPRETTLALPPGLPLLNANQRLHWAVKNRRAQDLKRAAWAASKNGKVLSTDKASITVEYQPPDRRRRDADNLAPTGKACIDGLVLAGVIPDDDHTHVTSVSYTIGPVCPRGRVILHIRTEP